MPAIPAAPAGRLIHTNKEGHMRYTKLVLAAFAATLLMSLAVTNASANRLSASGHNFRTVWRTLEFEGAGGGFGATRCPVTLEGSFHSNTIKKVEKALIGHISRASVGSPCTGGSATITQSSLPWKVDYNGFTGTLPAIRTIRQLLVGAAFRIAKTVFFTFTCDSITEEAEPSEGETLVEPSGNITTTQPDSGVSIRTTGASCPEGAGIFRAPAGDGNTTVLGATTRIRLTLI
jgi:hypothetical protein